MKKSRKIKNQCGQATIETITASIIIFPLLIGCLAFVYFCYAKIWLSFMTYEALICAAEQKLEFHCKLNLKTQTQKILPWGKLEIFQLQKSKNKISSSIFFTIMPPFNITENQELSLTRNP